MGQPLSEIIESWAGGCIDTLELDALPANASPRGWNSALTSAASDNAAVSKRVGCSLANATAITGSPSVLGMQMFKRRSGSTYTTYHLAVSDTGRLDKLVLGAITNIATPFTAGAHVPSFAIANNLCFISNGQENKKFDGTAVSGDGIVRPASAPTTAASATAGTPIGSYECRYTYYNTNTGHESSASDTATAVALTSDKLDVTWAVSGDAQVTHVKIYVRNTATMTTFRLVETVADGTATPYAVNWTDASLITLGPDTAENEPASVLNLQVFHRGRRFGIGAALPSRLVFSKLNLPEAFDPDNYEDVNTDDGFSVTALVSFPNYLLIAKRDSIWGLFGDDPNTWELRLLDPKAGITSPTSTAFQEGTLFFWSMQGPMAWADQGPGVPIGRSLIANTLTELRPAQFHRVVAAVNAASDQILFGVNELTPEGEPSATRNNRILPYNYRLQRWESQKWNPLDVASMAVIEDSVGIPQLYLGGYKGRMFLWADGYSDGVPIASTMSGTVTAATSTTLTDSAAAFYTTGSGLVDLYVYAISSDGLDVQRRRIGSNTATVLTLDTALTWETTPNTTYSYVVGQADFQWDTYVTQLALPFYKKRLTFARVMMAPATGSSVVTVSLDFFKNRLSDPSKTTTFSYSATGGIWDTSLWDAATWSTTAGSAHRIRLGTTGWAAQLRVRNIQANTPVTLLRIGWAAEMLTDKLG